MVSALPVSQPLPPACPEAVPKIQDAKNSGGGDPTPSSRQPARLPPKAKKRTARRSSLPKPRQQGDIDGLCGFYAIIIALRLAYQPFGGLSVQHEKLIWRSIVRAADRKWRFASLFLGGTHANQFLAVARCAAKTAYRLTGRKVLLKPLMRRDVEACAKSLDAVIDTLKSKGHTSILAGIDSKELNHWTVITGVSRSTLRVLDSDGFHYLRLDGCRLDQRPRPKGNPRYWVRIYGGFAVTEPTGSARASAKKVSRSKTHRSKRSTKSHQKKKGAGGKKMIIPELIFATDHHLACAFGRPLSAGSQGNRSTGGRS